MKNKIIKYFLPFGFFFLVLSGCGVKEEYLIGGSWEATAGYEDGKPGGEPYGSSIITEELEFKDEDTVYIEAYDEDFEYLLEKDGFKTIIEFTKTDLGIYLSYYIDKIDKDTIGLRGVGELQEDESSYMERK